MEQRHNILSGRDSRNGVQQMVTARWSGNRPTRGLNAGERLQAHVCHAACEEPRSKRHTNRAPASLQWKSWPSVPSPSHALGDDETIFSQNVVLGACPV